MSPAHYVVEIIGGEGTKSLLAAATKCFVPWPGQINHWPDHVPDVSHASTRHGPSTHAHAAFRRGGNRGSKLRRKAILTEFTGSSQTDPSATLAGKLVRESHPPHHTMRTR